MSTTRSSFDQYFISHKTISHRSAAAAGPEVRRECPMTYFPALPLLATNPGDATGRKCSNPTVMGTESVVIPRETAPIIILKINFVFLG